MDTRDAGRLGGQSKSDAKRKASAENGKKGGRPRKVKPITEQAQWETNIAGIIK